MNSESQPVSKFTVSFGVALAVASVVNALLVIVKEKSPAVQAAMRQLTGSHWVTHVLIIVALFVGLGLIGAKFAGRTTVNRLITFIVAGVGVACALIIGFYLIAG